MDTKTMVQSEVKDKYGAAARQVRETASAACAPLSAMRPTTVWS